VLDQLSVDDFKPAVGSTFVLDAGDDARLDLELIEARPHDPEAPAQDESGKRTPFALVFRGPPEPIMPQRIYRIEHDSVGPLEIFIVPLGPHAEGMRYEAVFA
jgi:hypothetical protein